VISDPRDVERARKAAEDLHYGRSGRPAHDFIAFATGIVLRSLEDSRREDREAIEHLRRQVYRERGEALEAVERQVAREEEMAGRYSPSELWSRADAQTAALWRERAEAAERQVEALVRERDEARLAAENTAHLAAQYQRESAELMAGLDRMRAERDEARAMLKMALTGPMEPWLDKLRVDV